LLKFHFIESLGTKKGQKFGVSTKALYLCRTIQKSIFMAILKTLSPKSINGQQEILLRYKSGKYAARAKSDIYVLSEWYEFVIGKNSDTVYKGKRLITKEMQEIQSFHEKQKIKFSELEAFINEKQKTADRNNSDWLKDCIDEYYQRGIYTPKSVENNKTPTLLEYTAEYIKEYPTRIGYTK